MIALSSRRLPPLLMIVTIACLLCIAPAAANERMAVITGFSGNNVPAEAFWDGNFSIYTVISVPGCKWDASKVASRRFDSSAFVQSTTTQEYGMTAVLSSGGYAIRLVNDTFLEILVTPQPGFVLRQDETVHFGSFKLLLSSLACVTDEEAALRLQFNVNATTNVRPMATFDYDVAHTVTEDTIRSVGIVVNISLQYDVFVWDAAAGTTNIVITTPADSVLDPGNWSIEFVSDYEVSLSLPPIAGYNISADTSVLFDIFRSEADKATYRDNVVPFPTNFVLPIFTIDGIPQAFCVFVPSSVNEEQLRMGEVTVALRLSPEGADEFVDTAEMIHVWNDPSRIIVPTGIVAAVEKGQDSTTLLVSLNSTSDEGEFDTNVELAVIFTPPDTAFRSGECGCGAVVLPITPSYAEATRIGQGGAVAEYLINEAATEVAFEMTTDEFLGSGLVSWRPTVQVQQRIVNEEFVSGTTTGFVSANVSFDVEVSGGGTIATIRLHPNSRYNIPSGMVEWVTFVFPGSATRSGLQPVLVNGTLVIEGVKPTLTIFCGVDGVTLQRNELRAEELWDGLGVVHLVTRGEIWDEKELLRWNRYHPRFSSAATRKDIGLAPFIQEVNNVVEYRGVTFKERTATLKIGATVGLTLEYQERIYIRTVEQLVVGPTNENFNQASFVIRQAQPDEVFVHFGGAAAHESTPIVMHNLREREVRLGLWFTFEVVHEVLAFSNNVSWTNASAVFGASGSAGTQVFGPFFSTIVATVSPRRNILNVSFPPLPHFDIDSNEVVTVSLPGSFYNFVQPSAPQNGRIVILSEVSPDCIFTPGEPIITEEDIRKHGASFSIQTSLNMLLNTGALAENGTIAPTVTSSFGVVSVKFARVEAIGDPPLPPREITFHIERNSSYDIIDDDVVHVHLTRFFFEQGERCREPLVLTIKVNPGTVYYNVSDIDESVARSEGLNFSFSIQGEHVQESTFALNLVTSAEDELSPTGVKLSLAKANATVIARRTGISADGLETFFNAQFPALADLDVSKAVTIFFQIPTEAVASRKQPSASRNNFTIHPIPEELKAVFDPEITETSIAFGGSTIVLELEQDEWIVKEARRLLLLFSKLTYASSGATIPFAKILPVYNNDSFVAVTKKRIEIRLLPSPGFDATEDYLLSIQLSNAIVLSGIAPRPNNVTIRILAQVPRLLAVGNALSGGSRALALGELYLNITLESDTVVQSALLESEVCPLSCAITLLSSGRHIFIRFTRNVGYILFQNTTFQVKLPPTAALSGATVDPVEIKIHIQGGMLAPVSELRDDEQEGPWRRGEREFISLELYGDRFVNDPSLIVESLARGTECIDANKQPVQGDPYDFCARLRYFFGTGRVQFFLDRRGVKLYAQPDEELDVASQESVYIGLTGLATESGLAPIVSPSQRVVRVVPQNGEFTLSLSTTEVSARQLASRPVDIASSIELVFVLIGERFSETDDILLLTQKLIAEGFTSSSTTHREPSGFEVNSLSMFYLLDVSANRRVAKLRVRGVASYRIAAPETIKFSIPNSVVMSSLQPVIKTSSRDPIQLRVIPSGGAVTVIRPAAGSNTDDGKTNEPLTVTSSSRYPVVAADQLRDRGLLIELHCTEDWDKALIAGQPLRAAWGSTSPPALEPNGFEVCKSTMIPLAVSPQQATGQHVRKTLILELAPNEQYALRMPEDITITLSPQWSIVKYPFDPPVVHITVTPSMRSIAVFVPANTTEAVLRKQLSLYLGIVEARLVFEEVAPYGTAKKPFTRAVIAIRDSDTPGERTTVQNEEFLLSSSRTLLHQCCSIHAVILASAPPSKVRQLRYELGIEQPPEQVEHSDNITWVYVCVAALVVALVGGVLYQKRYVVGAMSSGRNRTRGDVPDIDGRLIISPLEQHTEHTLAMLAEASLGGDVVSTRRQPQQPGKSSSSRFSPSTAYSPPSLATLSAKKKQSGSGTSASVPQHSSLAVEEQVGLDEGDDDDLIMAQTADAQQQAAGGVPDYEKETLHSSRYTKPSSDHRNGGQQDSTAAAVRITDLAEMPPPLPAIDVDETLFSGQPAGFLRRQVPTIDLPPPPPPTELSEVEIRAVYPSTMSTNSGTAGSPNQLGGKFRAARRPLTTQQRLDLLDTLEMEGRKLTESERLMLI